MYRCGEQGSVVMYTRNGAMAFAVAAACLIFGSSHAYSQEGSVANLAKQLNNPIANLISVPFQTNYDWRIGPNRDGTRQTTNFQPVIPFQLGKEWLLVSRTILPIVNQNNVFPGAGSQFGLGDTLQSLFIVPPTVPIGGGQLIYGFGPVLLLPTGTDRLLSTEKWGAGPTAVGLVQIGGFTVGALTNHIWSYAGDSARTDVSQTFIQPFASYTTADAWTFGASADMTYDWNAEAWTIPVGLSVSKLVKFGSQPVSLGVKARYYVATTESSAHGWGLQTTVTFLFPTGK